MPQLAPVSFVRCIFAGITACAAGLATVAGVTSLSGLRFPTEDGFDFLIIFAPFFLRNWVQLIVPASAVATVVFVLLVFWPGREQDGIAVASPWKSWAYGAAGMFVTLGLIAIMPRPIPLVVRAGVAAGVIGIITGACVWQAFRLKSSDAGN